jgi:hypothetical protein
MFLGLKFNVEDNTIFHNNELNSFAFFFLDVFL